MGNSRVAKPSMPDAITVTASQLFARLASPLLRSLRRQPVVRTRGIGHMPKETPGSKQWPILTSLQKKDVNDWRGKRNQTIKPRNLQGIQFRGKWNEGYRAAAASFHSTDFAPSCQ